MAQQKGSNDLNLLLKAKVVKLKVELDYKNSKLPTQVNAISKFLENKPVKLKVQLHATATDLNKQIGQISKTLQNTKSFKPLRIGVEMDVKGSADKIKKQLKEVMDVVSDFNKKYGQQLKAMQQAQLKAQQVASQSNKGVNIPTSAGVQNFNNIKNYVNQLSEAERQLRSKFGDGKGLFSSLQLKDSKGNLNGFIASLERANGVVEKIRYSWNRDKNQFQVVDRQTATNTEKMIHKASQSLADLQRELGKTGKASRQLAQEYKALEKAGTNGTLTSDMVKAYQTKVRNAIEDVRVQKEFNALKREEAKIIRDIANVTKGTKGHFKTEVQDLMSQAKKAKNMDAMKDVRLELGRLQDQVTRYNSKIKEANQVDKQRESAIRQLNKYMRETHETQGALEQSNIRAVQQLARRASSTRQMAEVQRQLNLMYKQQATIKNKDDREQALQKLQKTMLEYGKVAGYTANVVEQKFQMSANKTKNNLASIQKEIDYYAKKVVEAQNRVAKAQLDRASKSIVQNVSHAKMRSLVDEGDITKIKSYLAETQKLNIATAKVATNAKGVTRITATLESTGKTAKQVTYEIDQLNGKLRSLGQQDVFNRNANLGIFEQLRIAMARVPVWMTAMTAFYGSINVVKSMTTEILKLDKALTELRRVASDNISIDTMFQGGVDLSKELGNNVHDIMNSISELARTFGDFNERQLLAITKTATLMSNVSDLNAEEATNSLVGTMNAFNITAEESIRIVDALNEVDNNYAISTKQLAEGLSKSASTARTFGVEMEETIGHITAIGAVTMESGKIIGNGLKTIYSRITTIEGAKTALKGVGVAITDQEGRVNKVNDILKQLSSRWNTITDAQKQNIAVQVAGRYQLSRFLALMNNWEMASKSTETAMHSEGSAMRENAEYMKSFEARINQLKNSWTELSSAVGDSVLTSSLLMVINSLTKLAGVAIKVTDTVGALPVVFGTLFLIMNKMKIFDSFKIAIGSAMETVGRGWRNASASAGVGATRMARASAIASAGMTGLRTRATAMATSVRTSFAGMLVAVRTFGTGAKLALASTGIGALMVGLGFAIEWLMKKYQEKKAREEELVKLNKKMIDGYRSHRDGMDSMMNRYDELSKKQKLTKDEQKELNQLQADFAKQIPTTVEYVDANGKAHMKSADAMRYEIEQVKALSKAQAELDMAKFDEKLEKQAKNYGKITDKVAELREQQEKLAEEHGSKKVTPTGYGEYVTYSTETVDNTKEIQENKVAILMAEAEKTEALKKTIKQINDQTRSWLEANNMMSNISDEQLKSVETFINYNEKILRSVPNEAEFKKAYEGLFAVGTQIGTVFSDAFDKMSKSIDENDPQKDFKLEQLRNQLDGVAKAIPSTFYQLHDAQGNVVKSTDEVINGLKEIVNVTNVMGGASASQTDQLIHRLQNAGLSAEDAQGYLYRLANEENNLAIKAELASRGIDETTGSLESLNEEAMEAIDLTSTLFGYSGTELEGLKSHIQAMHLLIDTQGQGAKATQEYITSQEAVSDFLGITADELEANKDKYFNIIDALQNLKLSEYETGMDWKTFIDKQELTPNQKKILLGWNGTKDIITGAIRKTAEESKPATEEIKKNVENVFDDVQLRLPEIDYTSLKVSKYYVEQDVENMKGTMDTLMSKLGEFGIKVGTPTGVALFDNLFHQLSETDGKVDATDTNIYVLRQALNTAIQNPALLAGINTGLDTTMQKAGLTKDAIGNIDSIVRLPSTPAPFLNPLNQGLDGVMTKAQETQNAWSVTKGLFSTPFNPTFNLTGLNTGLTTLQNTQTTAQNAETATQNVVSAGSQVAPISTDLQIVNEEAGKTQEAINKLNKSLGSLGEKFTTGAVREEIGKIGKKLDDTKGKVDNFGRTLAGLASLTTGGLPEYVHQLGLLSHNLVLASQYGASTAQAQTAVVNAFSNVVNITKAYNSAIQLAGTSMGTTYMNIANVIAIATQLMINQYVRNVSAIGIMISAVDKALNDMVGDFDRATTQATSKVETMADKMHKEFKSGMNDIVTTASGVPARIGKAIRDNMEEASGAMDAVAKDMVKRFKKELGIHSPSRVFEDLGYWTIKGLSNGLSGEDLMSLGKNVFSDFGDGAFESVDMIKSYLQFGMGDISFSGGGAENAKRAIMQALAITGTPMSWLQPMMVKAQKESGFNPRAINLWDSNAKKGTPSKGLLQTIDPTFNAYKMGGFNDIYNPVHNAIASIRYIKSRYGNVWNTPGIKSMSRGGGYKGYAKGGLIEKEQIAKIGEHGRKEVIIPLEQYRSRALGLWSKAGQYLGIDPSMIDALKKHMSRGTGGKSFGTSGSFGASSGEGGGEGGGGDSGSSGIMQHSIYDGIHGGLNLDGNYQMTMLELDSLTKPNYNERQLTAYGGVVNQIEAQMQRLDKSTISYRDKLKSVIYYQNIILGITQKELKTVSDRNAWVNKRLKELGNTSKHTEKQRKEYNELQQEYDSNLQKIAQLKSEVESIGNDIKAKSLEIFTDFIDEIVSNYDKAMEKIEAYTDNVQFKIDVLGFVDPENKKELLNLQTSKASNAQKAQSTAKNKVDELQKQYDAVGSKKGYNSDEAKKVQEEYLKAVEVYEDYTIAVLQAEKDIKDTRASVADEGIKVLKDYHTNVKDMAIEAIDLEKDALEEAHKAKMEMYDEEVDKINSVYDEKLKAMDKEKAQANYQEELDDKNAKKAELLNKISLLSRDTSLEGRKKLAELQSELGTLNEEIADFQAERQDELLRASLEEQKQSQLDAVALEKETAQTKHDEALSGLDAQKEAIQKQFEDLMNNDAYWAKMREDAITGNFTTLTTELGKMKTNLDNMNKGIFDGLFAGFAGLSDAVKKQVADLNGLTVDNMLFNSADPMSDVKEATDSNKYTMTDGKVQGNGTKVEAPKQTTPPPPAPPKSSTPPKTTPPKSSGTATEYYTIKKGDTFSEIEQRYGLPYGSLQKLNPNVDPRKLQIGQKIVLRKGTTSGNPSTGGGTSSADRQTTSALNFRSSPAYGNNVMMSIPKGAKVDYIGMEKGWAKIKYSGKTGYVGADYLKKFDTGGYTGDWAGREGKIAMLHKKELVLNERQTSDILDTAKIMDKVTNIIPDVKRGTVASKMATAGSIVNISYGDINVTVEDGDKKKANAIASEILKGMKKRGK